MAAIDLQMTPTPCRAGNQLALELLWLSLLELLTSAGKLNGVWPIIYSMLNAYPGVRKEGRMALPLQWLPNAVTSSLWGKGVHQRSSPCSTFSVFLHYLCSYPGLLGTQDLHQQLFLNFHFLFEPCKNHFAYPYLSAHPTSAFASMT